jgi:ATP/maltotriose-dependent transcriptional regulator MalT
MWKAILLYACLLAGGAFALEWLQYQYVTRMFAPQIYVGLIALACAGLGLWAGTRLTPRRAAEPFARNDAALRSLGVTEREVAVLDLLAAGQSNKEIARSLGVSPNTVKSHILHLFEKLEVQRRTQAIHKARELRLVR